MDVHVSSSWSAPEGSEFGYGLVILESPDAREFTLLSARALTDVPSASLQPAYGLGDRKFGGKQIIRKWPPPDKVLGAEPQELPVVIPGRGTKAGGIGVEVLVGVRVPPGGTTMTGVEVSYTDGTTTWTNVFPHMLGICAAKINEPCESPPL